MRLSIVTPWHNCPELIGQYEAAVAGADEVIVVDNASGAPTKAGLHEMLRRREGAKIVHLEHNIWFSAACNRGYAESTGDVVLFLNNDVMAAPGWLDKVRADIVDGGLYGAACETRTVAGQPMTYLEGWCVAARRETWDAISIENPRTPAGIAAGLPPQFFGPWDQVVFPMYYSDVDLSYRAHRAGFPLRVRRWDVQHLSNYTSRRTEGAYSDSEAAWRRFTARVEAGR